MKSGNSKLTEEDQVRDRLDRWVNSVRGKNVAALMSNYAPNNRLFDLAPPLQYRNEESIQRAWIDWFRSFKGSVGYEISELQINASGDVAFCDSLNHIHGLRTDGEHTDVWVRATVGFRKLNGQWLISHEHYSVPFKMEPPYKAALDLKP
jgi:ketosteroid isomerase-like protein